MLVPFDGRRGEIVIRERRLSRRDLIDDPRDRCRRGIGHQLNKAWALAQTLAGLGLQIVHDLLHQIPEITDPLPDTHIAADALRINDFVTAHQDLGEILRQWLAASEQINDEHALADFAAAFDHQFQGRIADDAGVPIMFAPDGGPGECRGQAAAGEDVVHRDVISVAVENLKLRCLDIDGAHQQADWTFSEAAEIHILL